MLNYALTISKKEALVNQKMGMFLLTFSPRIIHMACFNP